MSLEGMPLVLENSLDMLLKENVLSSWQIRSGDQYTQVTMRFSNTAILPTDKDIVYRRAPPSQIARDRKRAASRLQSNDNEGNDPTNNQYERKLEVLFPTEQIESLQPSMDRSGHSVTDQPAVSQGVNTPSTSQSSHMTEGSAVNLGSEMHVRDNAKSGIGDSSMKTVIEHYGGMPEAADQESEEEDEEDEEDGVITCDGCGGMMTDKMGTIWYRCNECDDGDFCLECYNKDVHVHHKRQLSKFTCPLHFGIPYCSACGHYIPVEGEDAFLYKCKLCEDYCLCRRCKNKFLHMRHSKHLQLCSTSQYMSELG